MASSGKCRICRCTDRRACEGGCSWADDEHTFCSSCIALERFTRADVLAIAKNITLVRDEDPVSVVVAVIEALEERGRVVI